MEAHLQGRAQGRKILKGESVWLSAYSVYPDMRRIDVDGVAMDEFMKR